MDYSIGEIAAALGATLYGDAELRVTGVTEPAAAGPTDLALALTPEYADGLRAGAARAAMVWEGADWQSFGLAAAIVAPRPRYAMSGVTRLFDPGPAIAPGLHPLAVIDRSATIGVGAAIGPFVVVGPDAVIGPNARIASHASVGAGARIGADAVILEGARICAHVVIGDRFMAHPNSVIGGDGFAFVTPEKSNVEEARASLGTSDVRRAQSWTRIHSLGTVRIGDDVEVGSLSSIDRGTIRATEIGRGTKIDNQVQIGHNCLVGEDCLLCGQSGLAGSVRLGNRVVLGGKSAVNDNTFVGDDVVIGGGTGVFTNVPAGRAVLGTPALKMEKELELRRLLRRLPRLFETVETLKKAVSNPTGND